MLPKDSDETIERLLRHVHRNRNRESKPLPVKAWADRLLHEYEPMISRVTGEESHRDILLTHIKREKTKFQVPADSPLNPYDENRDRPLCTCGQECAIQRADEPAQFRRYDDLDDAVRAFKRGHPGHPLVLDEARGLYYDDIGTVKTVLRLIILAVRHEEIPQEGETPEEMLAALEQQASDATTGGDEISPQEQIAQVRDHLDTTMS